MTIRDIASPELLKKAKEFTEQIKNDTIINKHMIIYNKQLDVYYGF